MVSGGCDSAASVAGSVRQDGRYHGLLHHLDEHLASRTLQEAFRILKISGVLVVWEDIPTEAAWNLPGMWPTDWTLWKTHSHRFGLPIFCWNRNSGDQRTQNCGVDSWDYAVFVCKPRLTA